MVEPRDINASRLRSRKQGQDNNVGLSSRAQGSALARRSLTSIDGEVRRGALRYNLSSNVYYRLGV